MIYQIDIHTDRVNYIVHVQDEDVMFWIIPMENDGSDKWEAVQNWLDDGNIITDTIEHQTLYRGERAPNYPSIGDQLDDLFKAGAFSDEMATQIQAIKDTHPKPTGA